MFLVRRKGALRRKNQEREESIECSILIRPICFSQLTPILGQWASPFRQTFRLPEQKTAGVQFFEF